MSNPELQPLLADASRGYGNSRQNLPLPLKKHIGVFSAVFIIFNRIIGTGIFATPATILALSGSIGLSLTLWILGALIAAAGMQVYIVWGTALPINGAEKNYLEYLFQKPKYLVTCIYAANSSLMGWGAGNALIFGEYFLTALLGHEPPSLVLKITSFCCVTWAFLLHGLALKWGLRIQNLFGILQLLVVFIVVGTGFVALKNGVRGDIALPEDRWRGRENFKHIWNGTTVNASSICLGLYSIVYSFIGFSNANYAMSEMRDPARTIRIAGPLAVIVVTALYFLSNIAYFAGASKDEIVNSGRLVVSLLMRNVWGGNTERWVDLGVAIAALGNVLAVSFAQGRINQEMGKTGVLPLSRLWGSDRPFDAPLAGLGLHWFFCAIVIFFVPSGDMYNFVINMTLYPLAVVNAAIAFGLIRLYFSSATQSSDHESFKWHHLSTGTLCAAAFFGLANVFLFVAPWVKPPPGAEPYKHLPYWLHAAASCALFGVGAIWWVVGRRLGWLGQMKK